MMTDADERELRLRQGHVSQGPPLEHPDRSGIRPV